MNIDWAFAKVYDEVNYNCLHFFSEVWEAVTGEDPRSRLTGLLEGGLDGRRVMAAHRRAWTALARPEAPCMALMQRPRSTPHVGIYLDRSILHIQPRGVEFQPVDVASLGFTKVSFYK